MGGGGGVTGAFLPATSWREDGNVAVSRPQHDVRRALTPYCRRDQTTAANGTLKGVYDGRVRRRHDTGANVASRRYIEVMETERCLFSGKSSVAGGVAVGWGLAAKKEKKGKTVGVDFPFGKHQGPLPSFTTPCQTPQPRSLWLTYRRPHTVILTSP